MKNRLANVARGIPPAVQSTDDGLSHEDFMALSGLAPLPIPYPVAGDRVIPPEYKEACRAVAACMTLNDAKTWANKADALAAYAKIYADDKLTREARALKLHAYRRMGQLAEELAVGRTRGGAAMLLTEQGMTQDSANTARKIAALPQVKFDEAVNRAHPPGPYTLTHIEMAVCPPWQRIYRALGVLRAIQRHNGSAAKVAQKLNERERSRARIMIIECIDWLRKFERALTE